MSKPSLVTILAEDQRHQQFIRRLLKRLGYTNHDIRECALPAGRGCGEQWVRKLYPQEVTGFRSRSARAATALVVAVDADTADVAERETQLGTSLRDQGVAPRLAHEAVAHLIPKRSIETWVLCLNGQPVDETTDYKQRADNSQIPDAANAFFAWSRTNATVPAICIPSLRTAIPEIRRIAPK